MDIKTFLEDWIKVSNGFDTERYLATYREDAILDDVSVGKTFLAHAGIRDYFNSYFIGYHTRTELVKLNVVGNRALMEVEFTGRFPKETIGGIFDLTFKEGKIATVKANLI